MAIYAHTPLRLPNTRPPVAARRCTYMRTFSPEMGKEPEEPRQCASGSLSFLPELDVCAHHVPIPLMPVVAERIRLWTELAADLWAEVMVATPLPETGT